MPATSPIRLLVLDIDGTIAGKSNNVSPAVQNAVQIAQRRGVRVAIATGRMYQSARRFHQAIGADMPIACYQGAWIADVATNTRLHHTPLDRQIAQQLLTLLDAPEWSALSLHTYIDDTLIVREMSSETVAYIERSQITPRIEPDFQTLFAQQTPTKLLALSHDTDLVTRFFQAVGDRFTADELYITTSTPTFFEATHPRANKGEAVKYLAETYLSICAEEVMAIGDNHNDLEMLTYAGVGIAMGNAPTPVKDVANWVAPSVEADGVAAAIERFI